MKMRMRKVMRLGAMRKGARVGVRLRLRMRMRMVRRIAGHVHCRAEPWPSIRPTAGAGGATACPTLSAAVRQHSRSLGALRSRPPEGQ